MRLRNVPLTIPFAAAILFSVITISSTCWTSIEISSEPSEPPPDKGTSTKPPVANMGYASTSSKANQTQLALRTEALKNFCENPERASKEISANLGCYQLTDFGSGIGSLSANVGVLQATVDDAARLSKLRREIAFLELYETTQNLAGYENLTPDQLAAKKELYSKELGKLEKLLSAVKEPALQLSTVDSILNAMAADPPKALSQDQNETVRKALGKIIATLNNDIKNYTETIDSYRDKVKSVSSSSLLADEKKSALMSYKNDINSYTEALAPMKARREVLLAIVNSLDGKSPPVKLDGIGLKAFGDSMKWQAASEADGFNQTKQDIASYKSALATIAVVSQKREDAIKGQAARDLAVPELEAKLRLIEDRTKSLIDRVKFQNGYQHCGLSVAEQIAIIDYSSSGFEALNQALRAGGQQAEKYLPYRDTLNAALTRFAPYRGDVRRGGQLPADVAEMHQVGNVVSYSAFTSTSLSAGFLANDVFIIHSHNGHYIAPLSTHSSEDEVLFAAGTKFKVLSKTTVGYRTEYVLDEVDP